MLTVLTEMFGVKGVLGDMVLEPKLMAEQFDENNQANVTLLFADRNWNVSYINEAGKEYGEYRIGHVLVDDKLCELADCVGSTIERKADNDAVEAGKAFLITKEEIEKLDKNTLHKIEVFLV